jgi:hypothetical protein
MPKNRNDFHSIPNPSRLRLIKTLVLAGGLSALAGIAQAAFPKAQVETLLAAFAGLER